MTQQEKEGLTERKARDIINTEVKVITRYDLNVVGHLVGEIHLKGVTHFRFKPLDPEKNEILVPAWEIFRA